MELLEYQAKELFEMVDIPVLPSQTIKDSRKIKQLQIPYPVVLKSQVRSGGRGKAGGVRFVANTIDAIAAARSIFNLSILGEYPEVILAEAHYNSERELFLAIVLDYDLQCPVILGSALGGMNVDSLLENLQQVVVEGKFSLFYARRLAASMGLSSKLICSVSEIVAKMYCLFRQHDLDSIEINPLGVSTEGKLMALDGKVTMNDYALARQPIVKTLSFSALQEETIHHNSLRTNRDLSQIGWRWLDWHYKTGKVAIICNSFDSALLTWDLLKQNKVTPACSALLENSLTFDESDESNDLELYRQQLLSILKELESFKEVEAIVLNIWETEIISREVVQTIVDYDEARQATRSDDSGSIPANTAESSSDRQVATKKPTSPTVTLPQFILRLPNESELDNLPTSEGVYLSNSLEAVISQATATIKDN